MVTLIFLIFFIRVCNVISNLRPNHHHPPPLLEISFCCTGQRSKIKFLPTLPALGLFGHNERAFIFLATVVSGDMLMKLSANWTKLQCKPMSMKSPQSLEVILIMYSKESHRVELA